MPSAEAEFAQPLAKRRKTSNGTSSTPGGSRIFAPYRTLGLVSPTAVPFTSVPLGKTTFQITTSIGRNLHTYDLRRGLNLVFQSRPHTPATITATCTYKDRIITAWGGTGKDSGRGVWMFKRGKVVAELELPENDGGPVEALVVFGSWIVGSGRKFIEVWSSATEEHYTTLTPSSSGSSDVLTGVVCTLPTFLNKIFIGRKDGSVEIWNIGTGRLVHTLLPSSIEQGSVTAIEPAPAISMLAIAYSDGSIDIRDVCTDEILRGFRQSSAVTSITFRSDGMGAGNDGREDGVMATSRADSGDITFWDLNDGGKVMGILRGAHNASAVRSSSGINKVQFLPGQPLLVSSGLDNALKTWIFDETPFSPIPRVLHSRSGHAAPITRLLFTPTGSDDADAAGKWILSSSQDRTLWCFSTRKDGQSSELSQGAVKKKAKQLGHRVDDTVEGLRASEIISIACSLNRDGGMGATGSGPFWSNLRAKGAEESNQTGWESIVTAHKGDRFARTWFWGRRKAGRWAFETSDKRDVSSVGITSCGTFALVGSAGGSLDMFNLQSGIHRQRFPPKLSAPQLRRAKLESLDAGYEPSIASTAHSRNTSGVAADQLNAHVISCSLDGTLKVWDFVTGTHIDSVSTPNAAPITAMRYNSKSGLIALSCDDFCIRLVDIQTRRIVRELWGAGGQLYDHCFSNDGRWIVACSTDSVIRIWDLATGNLIDAFRTATTCTSLAFSSSGEYFATGHSNESGIQVWSNKSLYMHLPSRQIHDVHGIIDLSNIGGSTSAADVLAIEDDISGLPEIPKRGTEEQADGLDHQLSTELLTLSLVPRNRWETLLYLDTIKARNKPAEPPKQPEKAPFFLQAAVTPNEPERKTASDEEKSRISRLQVGAPQQSKITDLLRESGSSFEPSAEAIMIEFESLSPSAADLEIRSLQLSKLEPFVRVMTQQLKSRNSFELINTWMTCFLRLHGDFIEEDEDLQDAVLKWGQALRDEERRLSNVVGYCSGVIDFLRSSR